MVQIHVGVYLLHFRFQLLGAQQRALLGTFKLCIKIVCSQLLLRRAQLTGMVKFLNRMIVLVY